MQTNDPQRGKWWDPQGNDDQSFDDPNGSVEHGRDVNAPEKNDPQQVPQVDVSEHIREERDRQKNEPDLGDRSDYSPDAAVRFNGFPVGASSEAPRPEKQPPRASGEKYEPGQHR